MNIVPKGGNAVAQPGTESATQQTARDRALAKFMAPTGQEIPPVNPNQISPEELSAVKAPSEAQQHSTEESAAPSAPTAETREAEKPISSEYAILARKEKALRQREASLKAREAAIKAQEKPVSTTPPAPAFDESKYITKDRLTQDPFAVLGELGLTYDQLTDLAMNAPKPEQIEINKQIRALQDEIKALRGETESTKKSFQDQQTQSYQQAIGQIRNEVQALVKHDPNLETIKQTNSIGDVVELIEETFKQDGVLLTVEEAALQVEEYLVEEAMKLATLKKIQQRVAKVAAATRATESKPTEQPKQQQMKTLTNAVSSTRKLSARERALLAFEGKLNK